MGTKGKQGSFSAISDILRDYGKKEGDNGNLDVDSNDEQDLASRYPEDKYITKEFQKYGYDLAVEMGDLKNTSLFIKLSKEEDRALLETVRSFIKDAENVKNPTALFMWKLTQLKKNKKKKGKKK